MSEREILRRCLDPVVARQFEEPEHAPLPWIVGGSDFPVLAMGDCVLGKQIWGSNWQRIAFTERQNFGPEVESANAEFIVRAANSHHELVKACEVALNFIECTHDPMDVEYEVRQLRDAIAKAKSEMSV